MAKNTKRRNSEGTRIDSRVELTSLLFRILRNILYPTGKRIDFNRVVFHTPTFQKDEFPIIVKNVHIKLHGEDENKLLVHRLEDEDAVALLDGNETINLSAHFAFTKAEETNLSHALSNALKEAKVKEKAPNKPFKSKGKKKDNREEVITVGGLLMVTNKHQLDELSRQAFLRNWNGDDIVKDEDVLGASVHYSHVPRFPLITPPLNVFDMNLTLTNDKDNKWCISVLDYSYATFGQVLSKLNDYRTVQKEKVVKEYVEKMGQERSVPESREFTNNWVDESSNSEEEKPTEEISDTSNV